MKKNILIFLLFFLLILNNIYLSGQSSLDNTNDEVFYKSQETYKIFNELYNLIESNKLKDKVTFETIDYIKKKIENNELLLLVDHKNESKDILTGAFFAAAFDSQKNKPYILFNKNIINIFYRQKSIVFSMLIHEIRHAYDYFTNYGLFKVTINNLLERYLFQMDALHIEALLIKNFLIPNNYNLTEFEKILLDSFQNNNLYEYSLIFESTEMHLIYYLYELINNNETYEDCLNKVLGAGNNVLYDFKKLKDNDEDWKKYQVYISLYSYIKYINQIVYSITYNKHKKMEPNEFILNDYAPEISKLINNIEKLEPSYLDYIFQYKEKYYKKVENIYENSLEESTKYEYLIFNNNYLYLHIIPSDLLATTNNDIKKNQYIGSIEKIPLKLSKKYDLLIKKSIRLYDEKKYEEAAKVLEAAVTNEPENPFVLNYYARALYRFDKNSSFLFYNKLINLLDNQKLDENSLELSKNDLSLSEIKNNKILEEIKELQLEMEKINNNKIVIDFWFKEAYWKLGTLYLDRGDFLRGIYEISRSMVTSDEDDAQIREQGYSFLCESYCFLNKPELANYCKEEVFKINPKNTYILKFLDMLKK